MAMSSRITSEQVWQQVARASFAVVSYVTPAGEPRSSGVMYRAVGRRLCMGVAPDSWKARHIAASGMASVTVLVRRGGIMSLVLPIPPATISFHATAIVHAAGSPDASSLMRNLAPLLPPEARDSDCVIELIPEGEFLAYGVGVSLMEMRRPAAAHARVPVT